MSAAPVVAACSHEVGLAGAPDIVMTTTLSKALGSQGGAVLGTDAVRDHLIDAARTFIFDTGLAPAASGRRPRRCGSCEQSPGVPQAVLSHARVLARHRGVAEEPQSAVVSVILGRSRISGVRRECVSAARGAGGVLPPTDGAASAPPGCG